MGKTVYSQFLNAFVRRSPYRLAEEAATHNDAHPMCKIEEVPEELVEVVAQKAESFQSVKLALEAAEEA